MATFALQVVCATLSVMAAAPLAAASAAVDTTVSAAMEELEPMLRDQLEGLTLHDGADVGVPPQVGHRP